MYEYNCLFGGGDFVLVLLDVFFDFFRIHLCLRYALYIYAIPRLMQCLFCLIYPATSREYKLWRKRARCAIGAMV